MQQATNEWLLTARPRLRYEQAPFAKGVFAFNVGASAVYSVAAFAQTGPPERDTRGMAESARIDERWIGVVVLAPAVLDTWRYFDPGLAMGRRGFARREGGIACYSCCDDRLAAASRARAERERHRAFDDDLAVDAGDAAQHADRGCAAAARSPRSRRHRLDAPGGDSAHVRCS